VKTTPEQLVLEVKQMGKSAELSAPSTSASSAPSSSGPSSAAAPAAKPTASRFAAIQNQEDAPPCSTCGSIMVRSGACYKCANCGTTSGCA
jgi:ribonucleoside-diphosphate reductase alpha chain